MVLQIGHGRIDPTHSNWVRGERFETQTPIEGLAQLRMELVEEPNRGKIKCTILAHIPTSSNPVNIQNKKHLHWKALKSISSMNNEIKFTAPTHKLLLK
jgi:hypothetical protein